MNKKEYKVTVTHMDARGRERSRSHIGTIERLRTNVFGYTLKAGKSWEHEKGSAKVNLNPKNIKALIKALENAKSNTEFGYSLTTFSYEEIING